MIDTTYHVIHDAGPDPNGTSGTRTASLIRTRSILPLRARRENPSRVASVQLFSQSKLVVDLTLDAILDGATHFLASPLLSACDRSVRFATFDITT